MQRQQLQLALSVLLGIPLSEAKRKDFFTENVKLTKFVYDNNQGDSGAPSYHDYPSVHYDGPMPAIRTHCHCTTKFRYNYVALYMPTETAFILGSSCILLLMPKAFDKICRQRHCHVLTNNGFCDLHKRKCTVCEICHNDNHICICKNCGKKEKLRNGCTRCKRCSFNHFNK